MSSSPEWATWLIQAYANNNKQKAGGHAQIPRVLAWVAWERSPTQVMNDRP